MMLIALPHHICPNLNPLALHHLVFLPPTQKATLLSRKKDWKSGTRRNMPKLWLCAMLHSIWRTQSIRSRRNSTGVEPVVNKGIFTRIVQSFITHALTASVMSQILIQTTKHTLVPLQHHMLTILLGKSSSTKKSEGQWKLPSRGGTMLHFMPLGQYPVTCRSCN